MSNEIRKRRLIVTLPMVDEAEADTLAAGLERAFTVPGDTTTMPTHPGVTVTHALDDEPLVDAKIKVYGGPDGLDLKLRAGNGWHAHGMSPGEARHMAAHLLRAADDAEGLS